MAPSTGKALAFASALLLLPACGKTTGASPGDCDAAGARPAPSAAVPASCAPGGPGMTDCGPDGDESCCTSLTVPGGTFYRTYQNRCNSMQSVDTDPGSQDEHPATVSTFRLDKYEVTVGRFRQFVNAWNAGWLPPAGSGKHTYLDCGQGLTNAAVPGTFEPGWEAADDMQVEPTYGKLVMTTGTWTPAPGKNERLPMAYPNWYEAYAFCIWDGGFLPSGAEWEYAAAGGDQQRYFPWGSTSPTGSDYDVFALSCDSCEYCPDYGPIMAKNGGCLGKTFANIAPVGTGERGIARWGQLNMLGSVPEWVLDDSGPVDDPPSDSDIEPFVDPCNDCGFISDNKATHGIAFAQPLDEYCFAAGFIANLRWNGGVQAKDHIVAGLRCARAPP